MPQALAGVEAQVIRLVRAYSYDRANMMLEGQLRILRESAWPTIPLYPTNTSSGGAATNASIPTPVPFPATAEMRCMRMSLKRPELIDRLNQFRDGDVIHYYGHFATIYKNSSGTYVSDTVNLWERRGVPPGTLRSRKLLLRELVHLIPLTIVIAVLFMFDCDHRIHISPIRMRPWSADG
jgi:hypothetical protein